MSIPAQCLRWLARTMSAGLLFLVAALAWGENFDWSRWTTAERTVGVAFLVMILGNVLIVCPPYTNTHARRQQIGAMISLLGQAAFYMGHFSFSGRWPSGWVLPSFGLPAVLLLSAEIMTWVSASRSRGGAADSSQQQQTGQQKF